MKKDIDFPEVNGIAVAIVKKGDEASELWDVILINENEFAIENAMIVSNGFGQLEGEEIKTSTLRHMIAEVPAQSNAVIEAIDPKVFHLTNRFWVSYYAKGKLFDKKFTFVPETIIEEHLTTIPTTNQSGILHR